MQPYIGSPSRHQPPHPRTPLHPSAPLRGSPSDDSSSRSSAALFVGHSRSFSLSFLHTAPLRPLPLLLLVPYLGSPRTGYWPPSNPTRDLCLRHPFPLILSVAVASYIGGTRACLLESLRFGSFSGWGFQFLLFRNICTENMLTSKLADGHLPLSLKRNSRDAYLTRLEENKRIRSGGRDTSELLISGAFLPGAIQRVTKELIEKIASHLSKSTVSLSFNNGDAVLFECSGIAFERVEHATRFLTSSSFARALIDKRKDCDNLKVEVRHGGNVFPAVLREYYDLDHHIAVVVVMSFVDVQVMHLGTLGELLPHTEVVALGYDISGKPMMSSGFVIGNSSISESRHDALKLSTCEISKVCEGGPLFDYDGNFCGMNFFCDKGRTFCLSTRSIFFQLEETKSLLLTKFPVRPGFFKAIRVGARLRGEVQNSKQAVPRGVVNKDQFRDLDSWGYPKPTASMLNDGMILVNTFEDPFGDEFGQGVWNELDGTVSSNIQANTVALASFDGERRFFVCSGFFIEWNGGSTILTSASLVRKFGFANKNKIDETLRIEVLLPNKQRKKGILQHYNLHYNVALVGVDAKDFRVSCPAKIQPLSVGQVRHAVAVGYCFETCKLMAAKGKIFARPVSLDCKRLGYSTCEISKAGIGGPLLDFGGRFLAMNFYERTVGTPYLRTNQILPVLEQFKTEGSITEAGNVDPSHVIGDRHVELNRLNRWPVPRAYWCHADDEEWARTGDYRWSLD